LLIAIAVAYESSTGAGGTVFSSWGGGFTEFSDQMTTNSSTMAIGLAYKFSTGSETGTFTVTQAATIVGGASLFLLSIAGAHSSTVPEAGTIADATAGLADPGSFNPAGWGTEDTLWISVVCNGMTGAGGAWTGTGTAAPTSYTDRVDTNHADDSTVGRVEGAVSFRQLNAAAEDIGSAPQDTSNARNSALLIAVRPAPEADPPVKLLIQPSTPFVRRMGALFLLPNLLMTTLAPVVEPIPPGKQLSASCPRAKYQVQCDNYVQPLTIRSIPNPSPVKLSDSAPARKQFYGIAPTANLNVTTLVPVAAGLPEGRQLFSSAPSSKPPVYATQQHNVTRDLSLVFPVGKQWGTSAPWQKYRPQADVYPNVTWALSLVFPVGDQWYGSAPSRKSPVVAVQQHNILAQGINPNPAVVRLSGSAPFSRERPRSDTYANLNLTTLAIAPPAGAFPVGMQAFASAPSGGGYRLHLLFPQNLLTSTLALPPTPVLPPVPPPVIVPPPLIEPLVGSSPTLVSRPAGRSVAAVDYLDGERASIRFDFISSLARGDTITAQTVTATVYTGFDPAPSTLLIGVATASGTTVKQIIHTNTVGVIYQLLCQVTLASGSKAQMSSFFTGPGPKGA
jgi:hypothetical protein